MIAGIGIDLVNISRVERILGEWGKRFQSKYFTQSEITHSEAIKGSGLFFASNFAVKEAFSKAVGTGFRGGLRLSQVEVLRDVLGKPYINLYGKAWQIAQEMSVTSIHASISHDGEYAVAVVVLER